MNGTVDLTGGPDCSTGAGTPEPPLPGFDELDQRLRAGGVAALLPGWPTLQPAAEPATGHPTTHELLRGALLLGAQALNRDPAQLAAQLAGRLAAADQPGLRALAEQARGWQGATWLRPAASLTPPGGRLLTTLTTAEPDATAVAVTAAGQLLTGAGDGTMRWRAVLAGAETSVVRAHRRALTALAVTPDGRTAVSGAADCTVRRWELAGGGSVTLGRMDDWVTAVAVTPDGSRVVAGAADGRLCCWDLRTLRVLPVRHRHTDRVRALAVTPDGQVAFSAAEDGTLVRHELDRPTAAELARGDRWVTSIAVLPDGRLLTGHADGSLSVMDADARRVHATLTGHLDAVDSIAVDPDGGRAVSASVGHTVRVWDLGGEGSRPRETVSVAAVTDRGLALTVDQRTRRPALHDGQRTRGCWSPGAVHGDPQSLTLAADGRLALAGLDDSTIAVWAPGDSRDPALLIGHADAVTAVAVTPDGRRGVSGGTDRTVRLWDLGKTVEIGALLGHAAAVTAVAVSPDGQLVAYGTADAVLRVWEPERAGLPRSRTLPGGRPTAVSLATTYGGPVVVSGWASGAVRRWGVTADRLETLGGHHGAVTAVAVAPGARLAASAGTDHAIRLWDLTARRAGQGRELACFTGDWPMLACAFTDRGPGRLGIVACDAAGDLHVLEVAGP